MGSDQSEAGERAMTSLIEVARGYASLGFSVIPTRGKHPAIPSWKPYATNRPTDEMIAEWFTPDDVDGIAVICGPISGNLVCRDFDEPEGYERWAVEWSEISDLYPAVRTGRGGHVYFTADPENIAARCGSPCYKKLGDGELRYNGVYSLLPPSLHPNGHRYEWEVPLPRGPIPHGDPFAIGLARGAGGRTESAEITEMASALSVVSARSVRSVEELIARTQPAREGEREQCLLELARGLKFNLGRGSGPLRDLKPVVRKWFDRALPIVGTKDFDTTWFAFTRAFERAWLPLGDMAADALALAMKAPKPTAALAYDSKPVQRLVATCAQMQLIVGDRDFSLSCGQAATILYGECTNDVEWRKRRSRADRVLKGLERDEVIMCTKRGRPGRAGNPASRYRYLAGDA